MLIPGRQTRQTRRGAQESRESPSDASLRVEQTRFLGLASSQDSSYAFAFAVRGSGEHRVQDAIEDIAQDACEVQDPSHADSNPGIYRGVFAFASRVASGLVLARWWWCFALKCRPSPLHPSSKETHRLLLLLLLLGHRSSSSLYRSLLSYPSTMSLSFISLTSTHPFLGRSPSLLSISLDLSLLIIVQPPSCVSLAFPRLLLPCPPLLLSLPIATSPTPCFPQTHHF